MFHYKERMFKPKVVLFVWFIVLGQNSFCQENYVPYYDLVNQAEASLSEKDWKKSMENYEKAFSLVPTAYVKDYVNAAIAAHLLKNDSLVRKYLTQAFIHGYGLDEYGKNFYLRKKIGLDLGQQVYGKCAGSIKVDKDLKEKINRMFEIDQAVRRAKGETYNGLTMKQVDAQNFADLDSIINKRGFPVESMIGHDESSHKLAFIMAHNCFAYDESAMDRLKKLVTEGKLLPRVYAWLVDRRIAFSITKDRYYYTPYDYMPRTGKSFVSFQSHLAVDNTFDPAKVPIIDGRRREIGLQTVENAQKFHRKEMIKYHFVTYVFP